MGIRTLHQLEQYQDPGRSEKRRTLSTLPMVPTHPFDPMIVGDTFQTTTGINHPDRVWASVEDEDSNHHHHHDHYDVGPTAIAIRSETTIDNVPMNERLIEAYLDSVNPNHGIPSGIPS